MFFVLLVTGNLFPTVVRIRLSQPPAGDWLAWAGAELGNTSLWLRQVAFLLVNFLRVLDASVVTGGKLGLGQETACLK